MAQSERARGERTGGILLYFEDSFEVPSPEHGGGIQGGGLFLVWSRYEPFLDSSCYGKRTAGT